VFPSGKVRTAGSFHPPLRSAALQISIIILRRLRALFNYEHLLGLFI
jgi:hypothetical protein